MNTVLSNKRNVFFAFFIFALFVIMSANTSAEEIESEPVPIHLNLKESAKFSPETSGDFSVTTSTILKVENGQIKGALSQAGFSGNLASALNGNVILGDSSIRKGSYSTGSMHVPDVLLMDGLRINPA